MRQWAQFLSLLFMGTRKTRKVWQGVLLLVLALMTTLLLPSGDAAAGSWEKVLGGVEWSARYDHTLVHFNGAYVQMGGVTSVASEAGLWHAEDGSTWNAIDNSTVLTFMNLRGHASVAFNGKLWNLGGDPGSFYNNYVGSSTDGANWVGEGQATWSPRAFHRAVVFDGKMWVMGGENGAPTSPADIALNDVWYTEDGQSWTQATAGAGWTPRADFNLVVLGSRMYVLGGAGYDQLNASWIYLNDVWSSADGVTWTQETGSAPWSARWGASAVVVDNQILLAGGRSAGGYLNDLWTSTNGQSWSPLGTAPWGVRTFAAMAVGTGAEGEEILLTGGRAAGSIRYDDAWASTDGGATWTRRSKDGAPWAGPIMEGRPQLYSFDDQFWSLAKTHGQPPDALTERLWSSVDGEAWELTGEIFPWKTMAGTITEFQGQLWALGTQMEDSSYRVCSSANGITWNVRNTTGWNGGYAIAAAVQGGALWALVEQWNQSFTERTVELRRSSDGLAWTTITPVGSQQPEWGKPNASPTMLSYLGRLYVSVNYFEIANDQWIEDRGVWSSTDGSNWTRVTDPYVAGPGPDNVEVLQLIGVAHGRMWAREPYGALRSSADGGVWYPVDQPLQTAGTPVSFAWFGERLWVKTFYNGALTDDLFAFSPFLHVNFSHAGAEEGTLALPYNTLTEAVDAAQEDQQIQLAAGTSSETMLITKRLRLSASGGTVRIGAGGAKASTAFSAQIQSTSVTDSPPAAGLTQEEPQGLTREGDTGHAFETGRIGGTRRAATAPAEHGVSQDQLGDSLNHDSGGTADGGALSNAPDPVGGCIGGPGSLTNVWQALGDLFTLFTSFGILVFMGRMGKSGRD